MSKIYRVTVLGKGVDRWVMIVKFQDDRKKTHAGSWYVKSESEFLESNAKDISKDAILKRWRKLSPHNVGSPNFVQSFEIESLSEIDEGSLTASGIGPYVTESGVKVWMREGPFSFGIGAPASYGSGGAW
jgi:hypothetical protein